MKNTTRACYSLGSCNKKTSPTGYWNEGYHLRKFLKKALLFPIISTIFAIE